MIRNLDFKDVTLGISCSSTKKYSYLESFASYLALRLNQDNIMMQHLRNLLKHGDTVKKKRQHALE